MTTTKGTKQPKQFSLFVSPVIEEEKSKEAIGKKSSTGRRSKSVHTAISAQEAVENAEQKDKHVIVPEKLIDPDACPRCGKKALKSVRPQEYGGLSHYCCQCPGSEPGEPFRFTSCS